MLWCAWVLLLAAALQNRLAVAVVALALLVSHMWALALVPTYLLPALSPTAIHDIWASDLAPRFPEPETYVQRLAELLLAVGFLLSAAVLFQRRDGIAPRRGGPGGSSSWRLFATLGTMAMRLVAGAVETKIDFDADAAEPGWNKLGEYDIVAGPVRLEISSRTSGKVVVADAVRWVPVP